MAEKGLERRELVVHRNAESLENPAEAEITVATGEAWQGGADGGGQGAGAGEAAASQGIGEQAGVRFVGVFREQGGQGVRGDSFEQDGGGLSARSEEGRV